MARKKKRVKKSRLRMVFLGLTSVVIIVTTLCTIGHYWVEIYNKYKEKKELDKKLVSLKEKEEELRADANRLQDPDYIARYAREKYFYSKDGEFIIKMPEENE